MQPRFDQTRPFIGRPLRNLWSRYEAEVQVGIREERGEDFGVAVNRVMILIDLDGTRIGELARRASVSKQAMAEAVASLEAKGLVEVRPDPSDRRAKLAVLTKEGRRGLQVGRTVAESVHARWASILGEKDMERLVALLERLDHALSG